MTGTHSRFASPMTLLSEWEARSGEPLHEFLLLGFTVDLPFLERFAIGQARALGARVTVIGDAAHGLYDPVDVRSAGRRYLHGLAECHGAFHPKVALLLSGRACWLAVGSGNPTMSGWGANDELWTVVETEDGASHPVLADLADWLEALPGAVRMAPWTADNLREIAEVLTERHVDAPAVEGALEDGTRLVHNLRTDFLSRLPQGPVDELNLYAPFIDPSGHTLRAIVERLAPRTVTLALQPHWSSYDARAVQQALSGVDARMRLLDETRMRHGKLLEWRVGDRWQSLTGSPNLTRAALRTSTAAGGNCELAVLATGSAPLLPEEGRSAPLAELGGSTVRPIERTERTLSLLGAKTDSRGLHVALASGQPSEVGVDMSPDGSPGTWQLVGTIPAGEALASFPLGAPPGGAVRAWCVRPDGTHAQSPVVFVYSPVQCARREGALDGPRLQYEYTVQSLFTDESAARHFEQDLLRLRELVAGRKSVPLTTGVASGSGASALVEIDRWDSYLDECRRMLGDHLAGLAFGGVPLGLPQAPGWSWAGKATEDSAFSTSEWIADDGIADGEAGTPAENRAPSVPPELRGIYRKWARRWACALTAPDGTGAVPVAMRLVVSSLLVRLLAAGVWEEDETDWRDCLAALVDALVADDEADAMPETRHRTDAVLAVLLALLTAGADLTGVGTTNQLARRAWERAEKAIARAELDQAQDLMIRPEQPLARCAFESEVEWLVELARAADPHAEVVAELEADGLTAKWESGFWEVSGRFSVPVRAAAAAATRIDSWAAGCTFVRAFNGDRWSFIGWRRPDLVLLDSRSPLWRTYRLTGFSTPESRFKDGSVTDGQYGRPTTVADGPPEMLRRMLDEAGVGYPALLARLHDR